MKAIPFNPGCLLQFCGRKCPCIVYLALLLPIAEGTIGMMHMNAYDETSIFIEIKEYPHICGTNVHVVSLLQQVVHIIASTPKYLGLNEFPSSLKCI